MIKKLIFSLLLGIVLLDCLGQNPSKSIRTDLIPSSPTAGSIAKAGDAQVNLSTGLPGVNIPIFDMVGNDLNIPVSLSYNYDGFKPAQVSGWAGLGWNLDAGGVITRTVKGMVDGTATGGNFDSPFVKSSVNNVTISDAFLYGVVIGAYDAEPDIYNFSFPGHSGKFFQYGGVFYVMPNQKIKVTGGGGSFLIVTEDGTRYSFNETEYTEPKGQSGASYNIPSNISSWYLTKIQNASQTEVIDLAYTSEGKLTNAGSYSQSYKRPFTLQDAAVNAPSSSFPTFVYPKRLTSISTNKYFMNLDATEDRLDVNQSAGSHVKVLKGIQISSRDGSFSKLIKFNHSYFGSGYDVYLKLNSVQEYISPSGENIAPVANDTLTHKFTYVDVVGSPRRNTAFVDHYGYYKSGNFSNMLIPNLYHTNGVNRDPDFSGTVQGALLSITYPSGGKNIFEYEGNMANNGINYVQNHFGREATVTRPLNTQTNTYHGYGNGTIVIDVAQTINVWVSRVARNPYADNFTRNLESDFKLSDAANNVVFEGMIALESENGAKIFTTVLQPGTYNLKVSVDPREITMSATLSYTGVTNIPIEGKPAGGLRVKRNTVDPLIGNSMVTTYKYTKLDGFSSGSSPETTYSQMAWKDIYCRPSGIEPIDFTIISSYISENYASSSQHYYDSVLEQRVSGLDTLATRHEFQSYNNYFMGILPTKVTAYKRNNMNALVPATLTEYDYEIVQDTIVTGLKAFQNMVVIYDGCTGYNGPTEGYGYSNYTYSQAWKYLKSVKNTNFDGGQPIVSLTENIYDSNHNLVMVRRNGSNGGTNISKFKYPENYYSAISSGFLNAHVLSPILEQQTWTKRGTDSLLNTLEVSEYDTNLFKEVAKYNLASGNISALNNELKTGLAYSTLLSDTRLESKVSYAYNTLGRLIRQQQNGGIPISYKWGYPLSFQNYLMAQAKNALVSEFYVENFEEHPSKSTADSHTGSACYLGAYAVPFVIPNARQYIVTFFYHDGNGWHYKQLDYTGPTALNYGDAIDDIAIYPKDAQLDSYIYDPGIGLSASIDTRGQTASYMYDRFGRTESIADENNNIVNHFKYNYGSGGFYSAALSGSFLPNNCTGGLQAGPVSYSIPAGTFTSIISQQDANNQAANALAAGGQAYANSHGTCNQVVNISCVNNTAFTTGGGSTHSAELYQVVFKDLGGTPLYTFSSSQLTSGFSVPQGIYNIEVNIFGPAYSVGNGMGWDRCSLSYGNQNLGVNASQGNTWVISNVNLSGLNTATITLDKRVLIED